LRIGDLDLDLAVAGLVTSLHSVATWVIFSKGCALYLEEKFYWKTSLVAFCPYTVYNNSIWRYTVLNCLH